MRKNSILGSTLQIVFLSLVIKILGLIKQSVLASCCGASAETDAFFIATGILVQLCAVLFSSISISFLSIHTEVLINKGRKESNILVNEVLRVFLIIAFFISLSFFVFSMQAAKFFAPAYSDEQLIILSRYIKIMSSAFIFWCYYLTLNVVLETDKSFIPGKCQGLIQNILLIIAALFLFPKYGMEALVYSFLLSGVIQCLLITICVRKSFKFSFGKNNDIKKIRQLVKLSIPLIIGNAAYEINDIVDKQISTGLGAGNVSYLTYGGTINDIVTGIIVASVSTVLFSHYATWVAQGEKERVNKNIVNSIEWLVAIVLPIMVMCFFAGDQIVAILYGRGNFGNAEILSTNSVVVGYAFGFIFQSIRAIMIKAFYAFKDTKTPLKNGLISVAINIALSILLSKIIGVEGVALATSIAMLCVTILLIKDIKKYLVDFSLYQSIPEFLKNIVAALIAGGMVVLTRSIINTNIIIAFIIEGCVCVIIYYVLLKIMKSTFVGAIEKRILEISSSHKDK